MCALIGQFRGQYFIAWPTNLKSFFKLKSKRKMFFRLITNVGQSRNSKSHLGIEPQTLGFRAPMIYH